MSLPSESDDAAAVRSLALKALDAGDLAEAGRQARRLIGLHPSSYEGYLLLAQSLGPFDPATAQSAYLQLAFEKLLNYPEALNSLDLDRFIEDVGFGGVVPGMPAEETLQAMVATVKEQRGQEPPEVTRELEPHRLMVKLYDSWDDVLDRDTVTAILQNAEGCTPLLGGILKEWNEELLSEDDQLVVERALVLLGETGNPAILPDITEFLIRSDDDLSGPADWAFGRIAWQRPEETLDKIRQMIPGSGGIERNALAQQIGLMKNVPGRSAALVSLLHGIDHLPKPEQEAVIAGVIAGIIVAEGGKSPLAASLEKQYAGSLSKSLRADLRELRRELAEGPPAESPSDFDVYQICCEEPHSHDEEEPHAAAHEPRPGRNDPCWCGSGRKYKKCHLAEDEHR